MHTNCHRRPRAFTLIELMLAIAILAMISVTVYQFTDVAMRSVGITVKTTEQDLACGGLRRLFAAQLASLPSNQNSSLYGVSISRKGGGQRDALKLICPAGNALLTPDARGFYEVTLDLREIPRGSGNFVLGMERSPLVDDDDDDDDDDETAAAGRAQARAGQLAAAAEKLPSDWVRLMDGVKGMEIAYFDARLNGWVDKWTDENVLPNLVRLRLTLVGMSEAYEIVERVPGGGVAKVIPTTALPIINHQNQNNGGVPNQPPVQRPRPRLPR